jgi:hypothetical protein
MLKAGDFFLSGKSGGVVGAFLPWGKAYAGVTPGHIFHCSGTDHLRIGSQNTKVARYSSEADIAVFPVFSPCEPTVLAKPRLGDAELVNARTRMGCKISDVSWSIAYAVLRPNDLPGPGDSGTPVLQGGKVVGMLLSINLGTCRGILLSSEIMKRSTEDSAR